MRKQDVLSYFGGPNETAKFLGISHVAVVNWPEVIPKGRAYELQVRTKGKLRVNPTDYLGRHAA